MTTYLYLTTMSIILLRCSQPSALNNYNNHQLTETTAKINQLQSSTHPGSLLTLSDAEKIMGEPLHLTDTATNHHSGLLTYHCAYKANAEDIKSKKTGAIYFLIEYYNQVVSAQKKYTSIKTANQNHGIKVVDDLGDEAYFHTDRENFYFIMVRKGMKVFNMKVNKITSTTSLEEFNLIAKKITDAL